MLTSRPAGQDVVQPAEADVVGPAVAADDPDAPPDQGVGDRRELLGFGGAVRGPRAAASARPRGRAARGSGPRCPADWTGSASTSSSSHGLRQAAEQVARVILLLIDGHADAQPELGIVLEERVRPGRPSALGVLRPRGRRQVAAVDRRAARRVGDDRPVAEELAHQLQVRRLAAAGTRPGELEQRRQQLRALDRVELRPGPVEVRDPEEEVPARPLARPGGRPSAPC